MNGEDRPPGPGGQEGPGGAEGRDDAPAAPRGDAANGPGEGVQGKGGEEAAGERPGDQDDDQPEQQEQQQDEPPPEPQRPNPKTIVSARTRGGSRNRRAYQQQARVSFKRSDVDADTFIAGDQITTYNYPLADKARIRRLDDDAIEEIRRCFVEPENFAAAQAAAGRPLVIVKGSPGQGRYAVARRLLLDTDGLFGLGEAVSPLDLTAEELTPGGGYIKRNLSRSQARRLDALTTAQLTHLLREHRCRVVITVGPMVTFEDDAVAQLVIEPGRVRDRAQVAARHLEWLAGPDAADAILDDDEVGTLIEDQLAGDGSPGHARTIAAELFRAYQRDLPLARTVREALERRGDDWLRSWFTDLKGLSVQCMGLAIAVLGGEPYETVAQEAEWLRRRLMPRQNLQITEDRSDDPLVDTKTDWLTALHARVRNTTVMTHHGAEVQADVVEYTDDGMQERVLRYFFGAFDRSREQLLHWLRLCAGYGAEGVCYRTAVATGLLTADSFDAVQTRVILPWAGSHDHRLREAAAEALAVTAREKGMLDAVRKTIEGWRDEADERLRATAARAWKVVYTAEGATAALDMLDAYCEDDSLLVTDAVCSSLTDMWEVKGEALDAPARLLGWMESRQPERRLTGQLAFLAAAVELVEELPGDHGTATWPGLLWFAAGDPAREREIARLWRHALADRDLIDLAKSVLAEWVRAAEPEPAVRNALVRLLVAAAAIDRTTRARIRNESVKWAGEAPDLARGVQAALAGKA